MPFLSARQTDRLADLLAGPYAFLTANDAWRRHAAGLLDGLPDNARRVLDLGTGPAVSALAMADRTPGIQVLGVDLSHAMLARGVRARARVAPGSARRVHLIRGDGTQLPLPPASVDAVTAHSFLYLVERPEAVLAEVYRVLVPGGRVGFMEPNQGAHLRWAIRLPWPPHLFVSMCLWRLAAKSRGGGWRRETLEERFREAGLEAVEVRPTLAGLGWIATGRRPR